MKIVRRILAIIGILFLVSLYIATIVLSLTDDPRTMNAFRASIYCTFLIPVLIWAYGFIYKLLKYDHDNKTSADMSADERKQKAEE